MNIQELRNSIAFRIVSFNLLLLITVIINYPVDEGQVTDLVAILSPITAVYFGILAQHISNNIRNATSEDSKEKTKETLSEIPYARLTKWMVTSHFIIVLVILLLKPFSLGLNFAETKIVLATIETLFGAYLGYIITALFNVSK